MSDSHLEWWRGAVVYQIYPRSYFDSNGDGVGDLPGIIQKLPYVADLGVDAIWISPFFQSPMKDFGYDVSNYREVDPIFGETDDFYTLLEKAHDLNLKVIIDMVLSHTSDQHEWFEESRQSRENEEADWYVWADPKPDGTPPNNWQAHFGGPSWTFDIRRGQYYLHNFLSSQPDLNLRSAGARQAALDEIEFWLKKGVDGFRLDAARHFFCDPTFKDNPSNANPGSIWLDHPTPFTMQNHVHDIDIPATLGFMKELRALTDQYEDRMCVAEIGGEKSLEIAAQMTDANDLMHTAYTFTLTSGDALTKGKIKDALNEFTEHSKTGWPSWAFSTHDVTRTASRWLPEKPEEGYSHDPRFSKLLIMLLTCLRGTAFLYQGEELGLPETKLSFDDIVDPFGLMAWPEWQGRDGCRTPMPWEQGKPHAGFTKAEKSWLPVPEDHKDLCVENQEGEKVSTLHFARAFLKWRKGQKALISGDLEFIDFGDADILAFERKVEGQNLLCVFNLSDDEKQAEFERLEAVKPFESEMFGSYQEGEVSLPPFGGIFLRA